MVTHKFNTALFAAAILVSISSQSSATPVVSITTDRNIPNISFDHSLTARGVPALLEWTPDSATLISLEAASLDGWFRVQTSTGQVLHENLLPSAWTYHEIISAHELIMPGDMRAGVAFEVVDVSAAKIIFRQKDPVPDAAGTASGTVRFALPVDKSVVAIGYGYPRGGQPVTLYNTKNWQALKTLTVPADGPVGVGRMRLSNNSKRLAYVGSYGLIVIDLESGSIVRRFKIPAPKDFAFSPDGNSLAVAEGHEVGERTLPSELNIYQISDGKKVSSLKLIAYLSVGSLEWDSQGRFLAFIADSRSIHLWNPATILAQETVVQLGSTTRSFALSPDGKRMAVGDGNAIDLFSVRK